MYAIYRARSHEAQPTRSDTVIEVQRIESNGWVIGTVGEYRFNALIFREHAADPAWELADSMISKLWVQHRGQTVFNWDRGLDVDAANEEVQDNRRAVVHGAWFDASIPPWRSHSSTSHERSRSNSRWLC